MISYYSKQLINYSTWQQIKDIKIFFLISLILYGIISFFFNYFHLEEALTNLGVLAFKTAVYILLIFFTLLIIKEETYLYIKKNIKEKIWK
jgi:hypothetical protein